MTKPEDDRTVTKRPRLASALVEPPSSHTPVSASFQNDYSLFFVASGERPQNFIRGAELAERFDEFPAKRQLMERKEELVRASAVPPAYLRCDLRSFPLSSLLPMKFDVILIDPPLEEYARRASACGIADVAAWTADQIAALDVASISDTPSFCFLWCGSAEGVTEGRACLAKWGFRRTEVIVWVKSNKTRQQASVAGADSVLVPTVEHCLMGIKGNVRRSTDGHILHANCDTDVIGMVSTQYVGDKKGGNS